MSIRALKRAKFESEQARRRFEASLAEVQNRLQPAALTSNAWQGVKEKGSEIAVDAVQAVKERPVAVSAVLTAFTLFLARGPIRSGISRLFSGPGEDEVPPVSGRYRTNETNDPAAPAAIGSMKE
ncbi:hypothetical protein [Sphingosinicella rhizophila]|uniref:DUF3618 domain-containing protein n=1 Tax=Sphingosinicella rhizophila TaxID=3050082 RepID=A0ABU3Q3W5_9SPHN|nr:hypothetical protein [Sphingosinicella sp. GR2756]MDT9597625.1 hypothetical protein [Sphingosinicella sp. GR2756]